MNSNYNKRSPLRDMNISFLQVCLTIVFVTAMLISNVITATQVLLPAGIPLPVALSFFCGSLARRPLLRFLL